MQITQTSSFERIHIPARIYPAIVSEIREGQIKDFEDPTKMKTVYFWTFQIAGKDKTVNLEGMTSPSFNPKSKLFDWAKNILGAEPPITMDTDQLLNKPCQVQVEDKERDGVKYSGIKAVIPMSSDDIGF